MQMDYFRRPLLAGKNVSHLSVGTIRGNLRRSDPDGFSSIPYFPGAAAAQTLNVKVDGTPVIVTLTGGGLNTVIDDINAALGVTGKAYSVDGAIAIQTNAIGTSGSIEVTGGTASAFLGFDTLGGSLRSTGGDIQSSPEGRIGNRLGTSFPNKGENLNTETLNRALARLSSNSDVLFSEHMRSDAMPKKTAFTTSDGKYLTLSPTSTRAFTGLGFLSASSTKTDLSPFFFLVDQATGLPAASRVVGVVKGTPAGLPPYANATTWLGGGAVGNVLGVDLTKSSLSITKIRDGRVIECTGATFITNKVVAGDYVTIVGATNLTPWNNNGYRWVVEEVISETSLALRPMSKSELAQFGPTTTEEQPIVELNSNKSGVETFGTATVSNGTYCNEVSVVVDPAIPAGATYDLYVATAGGVRVNKVHEDTASNVMSRFIGTDQRPIPNTLLTSPTVTSWSSTTVVTSSGLARYMGRLVNIPSKTWANTDFSNTFNGGINYIYWDQERGELLTTQSPVKVFNVPTGGRANPSFNSDTPAEQFLVATVVKTGSNITAADSAGRSEAQQVRTLTVGTTGQFTSLVTAINHINDWETQQSTNGSYSVYKDRYSQFEILLTSDVTVSGNLPTILVSNLRIRGIRPDTTLTLTSMTTSTPIDFRPGQGLSGGKLELENLHLGFDSSAAGKNLINQNYTLPSTTSYFLKNVTFFATTGGANFNWLISGVNIGKVVIEDCVLGNVKKGILQFGNALTDLSVFRTTVTMDLTGGLPSPQIVSSLAGVTTDWAGNSAVFDSCKFNSLGSDQGSTAPALGRFANTFIARNCVFSSGSGLPGGLDSLLVQVGSNGFGLMEECQLVSGFSACTRLMFHSTSLNSFVERCYFNASGVGSVLGGSVIQAAVVSNCNLTINDAGTGTPATGIEVLLKATGNKVVGAMKYGIIASSASVVGGSDPVIDGNKVTVTTPFTGTATGIAASTYGAAKKAASITSNAITVSGVSAVGIALGVSGQLLSGGRVLGNVILINSGGGNNNSIGIDASSAQLCSITGNGIYSDMATGSTGQVYIKMSAGFGNSVTGNMIYTGTSAGTGITVASTESSFSLQSNIVQTAGANPALSMSITTGADGQSTVSDNVFNGYVSGVAMCSFRGNRVDGVFGTATATTDPFAITNNYFDNGVVFYANGWANYDVVGNTFTNVVVCNTSSSILAFRSNNFIGQGSTSINLSSGALQCVEGNKFNNCSLTFTGTATGNSFLGFGDLIANLNNNLIRFTDNFVNLNGSSMFDTSGSNGQVEIIGNYFNSNAAYLTVLGDSSIGSNIRFDGNTVIGFNGTATFQDLGSFSNNIMDSGNVVLTMAYATSQLHGMVSGNRFNDCQLTCSYAEFSSNIVTGGATTTAQVYTNCNISGSKWDVSHPLTFTNCDIGGSHIKSSRLVTLTTATIASTQVILSTSNGDMDMTTVQMSGCYVQCDDFSSKNCEISGSEFFVVTFDNLSSSTFTVISGTRIKANAGGISLNSSRQLLSAVDIEASGTSTFTGSGAVIELVACKLSANLSLGGQNVYMSSCEVGGTTSISTAGRVLIGECQLVGAVTQSASCETFQIGMSTLVGGVSTVSGTNYTYLTGNHIFTNACTLYGGLVKISSCTFEKRVTFPSGSINVDNTDFNAGASVTSTQGSFSFDTCRFSSSSTLYPTVGTPSTTGALYIKQQALAIYSVEISNCDFTCLNGFVIFVASTQDVPGYLLNLGDANTDIFWNVHITGCKFIQNPTFNTYGIAGNNYVHTRACIMGDGTLRHASIIGNTMISPIGYVDNSFSGGFTTSYNWYGLYCTYFQNSIASSNSMSYGSTWPGIGWTPSALAAYSNATQQGGTVNMFPNLSYSTYFSIQS